MAQSDQDAYAGGMFGVCGAAVTRAVFGAPAPTPQQRLRAAQRTIQSARRGVEREARRLKGEEQRAKARARTHAKAGAAEAARTEARTVAVARVHEQRLQKTIASLHQAGMALTTATASAALTTGLAQAARALRSVNRRLPGSAMTQVVAQFEQELDTLEIKHELAAEALDGDEDEAALDASVDQVLGDVCAELHLDVARQLDAAPSRRPASSAQRTAVAVAPGQEDMALAALMQDAYPLPSPSNY